MERLVFWYRRSSPLSSTTCNGRPPRVGHALGFTRSLHDTSDPDRPRGSGDLTTTGYNGWTDLFVALGEGETVTYLVRDIVNNSEAMYGADIKQCLPTLHCWEAANGGQAEALYLQVGSQAQASPT